MDTASAIAPLFLQNLCIFINVLLDGIMFSKVPYSNKTNLRNLGKKGGKNFWVPGQKIDILGDPWPHLT